MEDIFLYTERHVVLFDENSDRSKFLQKELEQRKILFVPFSDKEETFQHLRVSSWNGQSVCILLAQDGNHSEFLCRKWNLSSHHYQLKVIIYRFPDDFKIEDLTEATGKKLSGFLENIQKIFEENK